MNRSKTSQLQALYARLPKIECKRLCQNICGPIQMSREERRIIVKRGHGAPKHHPNGVCTLLNGDGLCSVYSVRPLICRLWGLMECTVCPHGCMPERWVTMGEAHDLMEEALRIGGDDGKFWAGTVEETMRKMKEEQPLSQAQALELLEKVGERLVEQSIAQRA